VLLALWLLQPNVDAGALGLVGTSTLARSFQMPGTTSVGMMEGQDIGQMIDICAIEAPIPH
jgi:hypothetical protein